MPPDAISTMAVAKISGRRTRQPGPPDPIDPDSFGLLGFVGVTMFSI
jgi:hypothetical protein